MEMTLPMTATVLRASFAARFTNAIFSQYVKGKVRQENAEISTILQLRPLTL